MLKKDLIAENERLKAELKKEIRLWADEINEKTKWQVEYEYMHKNAIFFRNSTAIFGLIIIAQNIYLYFS